jgi:hypothetical protein
MISVEEERKCLYQRPCRSKYNNNDQCRSKTDRVTVATRQREESYFVLLNVHKIHGTECPLITSS